jgi:uncharacterized protein (TIGR00730 family)
VATSSSPAEPGSRDAGQPGRAGSGARTGSDGPAGYTDPVGSLGSAGSQAAPAEIAVLGSARIAPGDPRHDAAQRLGRLLAAQGWTVVTGGYGGLMAAVSRAAAAAGGRTVGLPMSPWEHLTPDSSHAELRWSDDYAQRLAFLLATRVAIALPGGIGTLAEASAVWAAAQTEPGTARLVLVGPSWRRLVGAFGSELVVDSRDLALPVVVDDVDDAIPATARLLTAPTPALGARG